MTAIEIKAAIDSGKIVFCGDSHYQVIKDSKGQYLIECSTNNSCIGLTWQDGTTLNAPPEDFFIKE